MPRALDRLTRVLGPLLVVTAAGVAAHSVVRYRGWIVAAYAVLACALVIRLARRQPWPAPGRLAAAVALALAGSITLTERTFTYLTPQHASVVRAVLGVAALAAAALLAVPASRLPDRTAADAALSVAVAGYAAAAALLIRWDSAPRIDVWVMLQQGSAGLWHGENLYTQTWHGSPGVQDAFTYLPATAMLLAPARALTGDVRWGLVALTVLAALGLRWLGRDRWQLPAAGALLLLLPGTATQVEQGWTEPLLLACLTGWALAVQRGKATLAVVALALGLASKQHLVLLAVVLAAWRGFGLRLTGLAVAAAGALMLPWVLAAPSDFVHDTVTLLVDFPPLRFADTLYTAAMHELGWTPPFWLTGTAVAGCVAAAALAVRARPTGLDAVLRWCAAVLAVASLVNKQAFYNQYWLVLGLLVLAWATPSADADDRVTAPEARPAGAAA